MAIFWIVLGVTISIWSATFPFGDVKDPGPALLPFACGLILILLALVMLIQERLHGRDRPAGFSGRLLPQGAAGRRVAFTLGAMLLAGILFMPLGFPLTVFFLILFLMRAIQPQRWGTAVFYAFASAGGALIIFKVLLKSQLPAGFLGL